VADHGHRLEFSFGDLMDHHAGSSPGGVAHAFKVLQRGLPLLAPDGPAERREIVIRTAFGGPGARDAFECVTGAVSDGRYVVDPVLAIPELGTAARFVFSLSYRGATALLTLRGGFVTQEFLELAGLDSRDAGEEARLDLLKLQMAERVMNTPADGVYDAKPAQ
jgi:hypothetical protein